MSLDFTTRNRLPFMLNELGLVGLGVEVGVHRGANARHIRANWHGKNLILVDPWPNIHHMVDAANAVDGVGQASMLRMHSLDAACAFAALKTELFDFVYIDADHSYDAVKSDIESWWPLVKKGGVLAGHDWIRDGWHTADDPITAHEEQNAGAGIVWPYGVRKAVAECFPGRTVHVTSEHTDGGWQSWLVMK